MTILTRKQLLKSTGLKTKLVPVPELAENGEVKIIELDGNQRIEYKDYVTQLAKDENGNINLTTEPTVEQALDALCYLVCMAVVDEDNKPVFTKEDTENLKTKSPDVISRIGSEIMTLSGMSPEAIQEAKNKLKNEKEHSISTSPGN